MTTTTQTEELEVLQGSPSSNNSREALLTILPSIRETYCTLLRVSNLSSSYWLGDAEFLEFLNEAENKKTGADFQSLSRLVTDQIERDITIVFRAYNKRIDILSKKYAKGARDYAPLCDRTAPAHSRVQRPDTVALAEWCGLGLER